MSERAAAKPPAKAPKDPTIQLSVDDEIATVQTTASTTKKKEDMRNESTGITVGDSAHTLSDPDELYLNLVLEYIPDTVYGVARQLQKAKQYMPIVLVKIYIYQICRSLAYIHSMGICHRDIKPQNLLLDPRSHVVKLCDFGSAKVLQKNEPNVSYICSRYYRAPELIFGATDYTTAIGKWITSCAGEIARY
ncbi:unnamed protein product [Phytophthora lilii]|uniref:Unnamed protein product n=1 Tax=Phytophthora lilii TaxID=2077276 RepID=A0A9W6TWV1_9STRA|nr:unnamed protein product [Phytophthora lilii]